MSAPRILVVEDDPAIAGEVVRGLKDHGYDVELATDGDVASATVQKQTFDLIVLDIMLPQRSGFELLDEWRSRISTPVIVLTARTDLDDRLRAFDKGALDFLAKPFWIEELVARIRARVRAPDVDKTRVVQLGDVSIDVDARTVTRSGEHDAISLTPHEFNILVHLVTRSGRAITRQQLASQALSTDDDVSERTVDTHIARLRKKLGDEGKFVATVWGVGYRVSLSAK